MSRATLCKSREGTRVWLYTNAMPTAVTLEEPRIAECDAVMSTYINECARGVSGKEHPIQDEILPVLRHVALRL
jgi:hypothetical protein